MAENPNQHLVGKESPPATIRVDRARIRQFARAVGLEDPVYYDEEAARKAGYPGLIAPPTFAVALGVDDADPGGGGMPRPKWDVRKILHEGNEIVYERPIFAGDVLTRKAMLKSITTREGKSGVRTIYSMETAYYDASGKRVCAVLSRISEGQ